MAAGFFLATAFLTGFFDAMDLVVFLAMERISTRFSPMARKFFHNDADLFRHDCRHFGRAQKRFRRFHFALRNYLIGTRA
ncbi:MAG: hypothetical protein H7343_08955 [Undibacterium sp.]|nr:hypothetical protein [Opitutaceae bacterium]